MQHVGCQGSKNYRLVWVISILFFLIFMFSCKDKAQENQIVIAVASNMQYALKELVVRFNEESDTNCELVISSSGKLTAQILEGAPYDIFLSADMKYPQKIHAAGRSQGVPKIYAEGHLVLWTNKAGLEPSIDLLQDGSINHIAIANPETAPYGKAAMAFLTGQGIDLQIQDKLVYGESISQVNRFVTSGSAELGITAKAVVLTPQLRDEGRWIALPDESYTAIKQGVVIIKRENGQVERAKEFYNFLFSASAKKVLKDFGYSVSE